MTRDRDKGVKENEKLTERNENLTKLVADKNKMLTELERSIKAFKNLRDAQLACKDL